MILEVVLSPWEGCDRPMATEIEMTDRDGKKLENEVVKKNTN